MVVREKIIFNKTYEKVGVARSHFSSHCNAVDLLVVVVNLRLALIGFRGTGPWWSDRPRLITKNFLPFRVLLRRN